jgi:hypothetical protein
MLKTSLKAEGCFNPNRGGGAIVPTRLEPLLGEQLEGKRSKFTKSCPNHCSVARNPVCIDYGGKLNRSIQALAVA